MHDLTVILLALVLVAVLVASTVAVVVTTRGVAEVRAHAENWTALAATQRTHDLDIRRLRQIITPGSARARRPTPKHLQALPPAPQHMEAPSADPSPGLVRPAP